MRQTLDEWEASIEPYFKHISLLGEIPITYIELENLSNLFQDLVKRSGQAKATHILTVNYSKTFITFLAAVAALNVNRDYWRVVSEATGIPIQRLSQLQWGEYFLKHLGIFHLPTFKGVGGYRFVTPIRLHGGIPAYSLPDFFAYVLWPSVKNEKYKALPTEKLFQTLLKRTTVQYFVDSPVTNFLENGGDYAVEFLDRCRKMARLYLQSNEVPTASEVNLPPYVMRTFKQWVEEELETDKGTRLRSPKVILDPWGPDFYISLPSESVEGLLATRSYSWRIEMQGQDGKTIEHIERVRVRRRGYDLETEKTEFPLENPSSKIVVSYCSTETGVDHQEEQVTNTIRRWRIDLFSSRDQSPLIVFHPNDGRLLRWNQTLPAEELWLVYPDECELSITGEGQILENYPELYVQMGIWKVKAWDLSKAHSLQLVKNGKSLFQPISILSQPPDPILVGDNLLASNADPDGIQIYIGSPPSLRIPIRPGRSVSSELNNWHINLESRWQALPKIHNKGFPLVEYPFSVEGAENSVNIALSAFLGKGACGSYRMVSTGPYGMRTEHRFRVWPNLIIDGLEKYYLPSQRGPQEVRFSMKIPDGCEVLPQAGVQGVNVREMEDNYQVIVDLNVSAVDLYLIKPLAEGEPIRLPLSLAIPRLRWAFLLEQEAKEIAWISSPIKSTVGAFLQSEQKTLYFEFPFIDELPLTFNIQMVNPENGEFLQEHIRPQKVHKRKTHWRFPLGEFSDTIRQLGEQPLFEFQLVINNSQTGEILVLPVLRLSRELEITDVQIEFPDSKAIVLKWTEPKPLRNRRVLLWSEWQPWLPPKEIKIPDHIQGELKEQVIDLPPSYYRLHFFTAATWEEIDPPALPPVESHSVKAASPQEMLDWIDRRIDQHPDNFLLHFFKACVLEALDDKPNRDEEITWCYQNLTKTMSKNIMAFHHWLGGEQAKTRKLRDPNTQKAVRISMFRPELLRQLLKAYPENDAIRTAYLDIYPTVTLINPETALMILNHDSDPARVIHSLQVLIQRESPQTLDKIIEIIEEGQLSDADACELLATNPEFSLFSLGELTDSPFKLRLIKRMVKLLPDQEYFVLPEFWVRTTGGWGRIEKICVEENDKELACFNRKKDMPILTVILRPDDCPERIWVDLVNDTITFLDANKVYICTKEDCNYFASENINFIRNEHNRASHMGLGPAFRPSAPLIHMNKPNEYSMNPPENQFA
jgi:RNA polymerase primary sigma factor